MTNEVKLQQLFTEHGIPRRLLYPPLYRINQSIGLRHKPPVLFNLIEYYLYTIPAFVLVAGTGALVHYWLAGRPLSNIAPILVAFILVPLAGWFRYWLIRRRIGLIGNAASGD